MTRYEIEVFEGWNSECLCVRNRASDGDAAAALDMEASQWDGRYRLVLTNTETGQRLGETKGSDDR